MTLQNKDKRGQKSPESEPESEKEKETADLDHIMNEIEELQQNMDAKSHPKIESPPKDQTPLAQTPPRKDPPKDPLLKEQSTEDILKELSGSPDEPWLEESLSQLNLQKSDETGESESAGTTPMTSIQGDDHPEDDLEEGGTLSMAIRGKMTVKLNYELNQSIRIGFQKGALCLQLADGAELKIPIKTKNIRKPNSL